jgi:hypothetical protein
MEDLEADTPKNETSIPVEPPPAAEEPQPADDVRAPKFLFSMNSRPLEKEDTE